MARPRKDAGMEKSDGAAFASSAVNENYIPPTPAPPVKVGDVVIYAHRPVVGNNAECKKMPLTVTSVYGNQVNGVVVSDDAIYAPRGCKVVTNVKFGDGPNEWLPRQ